MKTLVLKKSELDKLSPELQNELNTFVKLRDEGITSLKNRVKNLKNRWIDHRTDNDIIELKDKETDNLFFDRWHKTAGEEWGNCRGSKYTVRIGTKYIRVDIEGYTHEKWTGDNSVYISDKKLSEILDLLEEAERSSNSVDSDKLYMIASQRLSDAVTPEYY